MSIPLFEKTSIECSRRVALNYSTSFSLGIRLLSKEFRWAIFSIYGFVRLADEIVDTFHHFNKEEMLGDFKAQTYKALRDGISTNPILQAFQLAANKYNITEELIEPFFVSMEEDLRKQIHNDSSYAEYIYGSAEVVGLMCLKVFCKGDETLYHKLYPNARSLGAAFQKVNFLRDMASDFEDRGRVYFPGVDFNSFSEIDKRFIISEVKKDFSHAYEGIIKLPVGCRLGVYTAYIYYLKLLEKIEQTRASEILENRIRIPDREKLFLLLKSYFKEKFLPMVA